MKSLQELSGLLDGVTWRGNNSFQARCPCHNDKQASLTVSTLDNGGIGLFCHAGCITENILAALGLTYPDVLPDQQRPKAETKKFDFDNIVAAYDYRNGTCKLRDKNKSFLWQHKEPDGQWKAGRGKAKHCLYQAGEIQSLVCVTEGEKDSDNLSKLGFCCVSSENGAGTTGKKWFEEYTTELTGKDCVLFPDNDTTGQEFMQFVAAQISGKAKSVKVLNLLEGWQALPEKGDVSDLIDHFGADQAERIIRNLIDQAEEWTPFEAPEEDIFSSFNFYSVPDLTEAERKPPEFIIDGMLPVGMTFLSGAPKIRKSFLALQMAIAVATGTPFFGHDTLQCDVVYFDLEGSKSRISARTQRMTTAIPANVFVTNRIQEKLSGGLTEKIQALHKQRPSIRFIIIDTYSRARGSPKAFGQNAYDADVSFLEPVQQMALQENIAILFVHHDKKGAGFASDSFERLSGTMGISGSADAVLNLIAEGKRFDGKAKLEFTPRDAIGGELNLAFSDKYTEWQAYETPKPDLQGSPVCAWIISHPSEPRTTGVFMSYEELYYQAFHSYSDKSGERIRELLEPWRDELIQEYSIGVQMGVRFNGKRGIRIINLQ